MHYERYREGLIKRHICRNGRFLQQVLLVEQKAKTPHPDINAIKRSSIEPTPSGIYQYEAFPVLLNGYLSEGDRITGKVVGGGDNPLLLGGLAMAFFSLESVLGVSAYSYNYALHLLRYFTATEGSGGTGWFKRKRHHWYPVSDISKDELCGLFLGLHFLHKATRARGDSQNMWRVNRLMIEVAGHLKREYYSPAGAWLFQFPFTRVFKFNIGASYLCGRTFPFIPNFGYKPKSLYFDTMRKLKHAYQGATIINKNRNFFNVALYLHTALMIHDNPVTSTVRQELWTAFEELFEYFGRKGSSTGSGAGAENAYLGLMARAIAREVGLEWAIAFQASQMYDSVISPNGVWCTDLPLCDLPSHGDIKAAAPFGGKLWGECFTWQHSDNPHGHVLKWDWGKTSRSIGPSDLSLLANDMQLNEVAETGKGFRVEGAGLGLLFARALAAYFGFAKSPQLSKDVLYPVLPVDGPEP
jgi:hypothetical protein